LVVDPVGRCPTGRVTHPVDEPVLRSKDQADLDDEEDHQEEERRDDGELRERLAARSGSAAPAPWLRAPAHAHAPGSTKLVTVGSIFSRRISAETDRSQALLEFPSIASVANPT